LRVYEDREGQKRNVTEVVVTTLRFLGPAKNGNGAKSGESSKAAEPVDESENPFNGPGSEGTEEDIPF
jgi:single-stranded DNA-binding protein